MNLNEHIVSVGRRLRARQEAAKAEMEAERSAEAAARDRRATEFWQEVDGKQNQVAPVWKWASVLAWPERGTE